MNLIREQGLLLNNTDIRIATLELENFLDAPNYDAKSVEWIIYLLRLATLNSQHEGLYLIKTIKESTYWSIWLNCFRLVACLQTVDKARDKYWRSEFKHYLAICKMTLKQQLSRMSLLPTSKLLNQLELNTSQKTELNLIKSVDHVPSLTRLEHKPGHLAAHCSSLRWKWEWQG